MAYSKFDNQPVYVGAPDSTGAQAISNANQRLVAATQVQFNYAPAISNIPILGKQSSKDNLLPAGPPNVSVSFSALLEGNGDGGTLGTEFNPFDYTGEQGKGCRISIGSPSAGIVLTGCYLTNISLSVSPYTPVSYNADFVCYGVPNKGSAPIGAAEGGTIAGVENDGLRANPTITGTAHGIYSLFSGGSIDQASEFEAINYTYSAVYTPVYQIGKFTPEVFFTSATQTLQVQTDDIAGITPLTGKGVSPTVQLRNSKNLLKAIEFNALLNGESASVSAGDVARASLNIVQPLK